MLKTLKNIILIDETLPLEQIKRQYKSKTYWFLGLSWLVSFLLIWIIPQDIMQYGWAKSFVDFMGYIVPMVDGLEHIRLYGSSDPYKAHLIVLPHISFYYALLWAYAWVSVPYMIWWTQKSFIYNAGGWKEYIKRYKYQKIWYYFGILFASAIFVNSYFFAEKSKKWFQISYSNYYTISIIDGFISTTGILFITLIIFYVHFLIKQQGKQNAN